MADDRKPVRRRGGQVSASGSDYARVRKQYHFWPGEHGLDAWDVDRLIEVSNGLPVREVELASISEIDSVYWFDDRVERPTVRRVVDHARLIEEVDLSYPIILGVDSRVMDGMHRIAKALLQGRGTISAVKFDSHLEPDYRDCRPEDLPY
jgi:hypothetical protein